ncbi:hypothetical protein KIN20_035618, partial [Parelaphostrongylus tenuis]
MYRERTVNFSTHRDGELVSMGHTIQKYGNVEDAVWLEKAGMKEFTALFMTLPPHHMTRIATAACAKHEKQLTCGAEYEGVDVTKKTSRRFTKNRKSQNECEDPDFIRRVYPCIGHNASTWIQPCAE